MILARVKTRAEPGRVFSCGEVTRYQSGRYEQAAERSVTNAFIALPSDPPGSLTLLNLTVRTNARAHGK